MRYVNCGTDNIWIDCAQLENGAAMSAYNLVQNGGFEDTSSTVWKAVNCTTGDKYYTGGTYGRHFYMKGEGSKDNAGRHESYNYNSASDMTKLTTADNKAYKFTYSDTYKHRMLSAASESSGVKNSFEYDGSGNLTKTRVDKSGYAKYIEQYSEYTSDGLDPPFIWTA